MKKDLTVYLNDILTSIEQIKEYQKELTKKKFTTDIKTQDAIIRRLEIIGEASRNLSQDEREKYSEIPWKEIIGTRDKLIHGYFYLDLDLVWEILSKDLPDLENKIRKII